jgi:hypothetical protein
MSTREIREAILAWLKARDMPSPGYVGDTDTVRWTDEPAGVRVEWTEQDEI